MIQVIKFILNCVAELMSLLFNIELSDGISIGFLMVLCFILLPITLRVLKFIRQDAVDELNDDSHGIKRLKVKKGRD